MPSSYVSLQSPLNDNYSHSPRNSRDSDDSLRALELSETPLAETPRHNRYFLAPFSQHNASFAESQLEGIGPIPSPDSNFIRIYCRYQAVSLNQTSSITNPERKILVYSMVKCCGSRTFHLRINAFLVRNCFDCWITGTFHHTTSQ
jgi:hypothetical protein